MQATDANRNPHPDDELPLDCDVLIIGAGISGIDMACRLQQQQPPHSKKSVFKRALDRRPYNSTDHRTPPHSGLRSARRFLMVDKRADLGGTWDLFKYPGIRSDSDALTFGYSFRPWLDHRVVASGHDIKAYLKKTAQAYGLIDHIRYQHEVTQLAWSSEDQYWSVRVKDLSNNEVTTVRAWFVVAATGYYDYEQGYRPHFENEAAFAGAMVHPQHWHAVDYDDKKIVIIGSGATAMTLLPALVDEFGEQTARHVTLLQRTPTYVASVPADDPAIDWLSGKRSLLSKTQAARVLRARNILKQRGVYELAIRAPTLMRWLLERGAKRALVGSGIDPAHFSPPYKPWEERVCAVPDGDLFRALQEDRADIITDTINGFTSTGIALSSGKHIDADIIVTATGLNLQVLGGASLYVDGEAIDVATRMTYKAVLVEDVPNMAVMFGYTNASWTLKIDLACRYVIRLFQYMDRHRYQVVRATAKHDRDQAVRQVETVMGSLSAGYVTRAQDRLPKQGDRYPWRVSNNYFKDRVMLTYRRIKDDWLRFDR